MRNGKGSSPRPTDLKRYGDNYDRVFGRKDPEPEAPSDMPSGCLACNEEAVAAALEAGGIDIKRFTRVTRPRHAWDDVLPCPDCGQCWLVDPARTDGP